MLSGISARRDSDERVRRRWVGSKAASSCRARSTTGSPWGGRLPRLALAGRGHRSPTPLRAIDWQASWPRAGGSSSCCESRPGGIGRAAPLSHVEELSCFVARPARWLAWWSPPSALTLGASRRRRHDRAAERHHRVERRSPSEAPAASRARRTAAHRVPAPGAGDPGVPGVVARHRGLRRRASTATRSSPSTPRTTRRCRCRRSSSGSSSIRSTPSG